MDQNAAGILVTLCKLLASPAFLGCLIDKTNKTKEEIIASVKIMTE
jgi:hypothetical protein